ncbi:transcriptional repressor [Metallumcola ferriviriculae]|uniref:Transcriptional repressor n=1 Tax=Metallumcola ferriviriculae TaxID=3039180 RepID=A0AAU0UQF4_9FIRM|nr:transcriptional repressor [Desulfitibacteraceae bacterium MK1]
MQHERANKVFEMLKQKDYKVTPQRKEILTLFLKKDGEHLSAEEVYRVLQESHPEIGLATVYRTLDLFAELDVLQKLSFDDGKNRYELNDSEIHHHHHLICLNCGKVLEFGDDLLEALEEQITAKIDFKIIDHKVKFYGYCSGCY